MMYVYMCVNVNMLKRCIDANELRVDLWVCVFFFFSRLCFIFVI